MRERLRTALRDARVTVAAIVRARMQERLRPRALPRLVRMRLRGTTGPSALYRLNAAAKPEAEALVWADRRLTWAQLDRRVDRLCASLSRRHGLGPGTSAVVLLPNRGEALEIQAAMSRLGGSAVPVSYRSTPSELDYLVTHSQARAIFVDGDLTATLAGAHAALDAVPAGNVFVVGAVERARALQRAGAPTLPGRGWVPYEQLLDEGEESIEEHADGGSVVIYTSGTTGRPKGAVRTFPKEMQQATLRFLLETPMRSDDRHLAVCPMYHSTAFGFIGFTVAVGGTVVIAERFDPERFLALVAQERITTTALVPTMIHRICELPQAVTSRYDTRSLRAVFSGGSALSGALARRFMDRFGHVLYNFYGSTETGINTIATPEELLRSPGTIGHVVPGNELRITDESGLDLPRGQTGELFIRNDMLVTGYHRDEAATRASMRDGFFSVGDLGHMDDDGLLHLDGRKRDMLISGGVNVYPAEVEEALASHPAVAEAAVVGVPDDEWGERVHAYVSLRGGAGTSAEELIAHARRVLSGPKVPRTVVILPDLPKNPTGKVLKRELRERAGR